jgi:hypothetical protein
MSNKPATPASSTSRTSLRKLPFTHGIEVENFITDRNGDILEDGKELVAVWDQMFNGALRFLQSLTSSSTSVPNYIRQKIRRVVRKDVERHGKIIRYVQIHYQFNGKTIAINVFGPDPNISQITWLLELVTPPCEYLEELDWWINTLYKAAAVSITKGYNIQPLGFNPYQSEYRAGVTCGEHHHIGNFKTNKEKLAIYNMIRAYIPHLIALSSTSPFVDRKPLGKTILKQGSDGRTLILAPDCVRSFRLKENSGQLGPNIPEYLPHVGPDFTRQKFSRYVRKEIPDDRYVDAFPFTDYGTIEFRFFDAQYDQRIRMAIVILIQALALKASKLIKSGQIIPEVKGNTLYEHRKRAVNFGLIAKFQGDPSIESAGGEFVKHYNHNPETGGAPGKIFNSLKSLMIWLKNEFQEMNVTERDITPLLIMLWGTARIAPPISATTFMLYSYERNHSNISNLIKNLALLNGVPRKSFCEVLGKPDTDFASMLQAKVAAPKRTATSTNTSLARKLQQDSRLRRKKVMAKERARLKAKQALKTKMLREQVKKNKELEQKRQERLKKLEISRKTIPKPTPQKTKRITPSSISLKKPASTRTKTTTQSRTTPKQTQKTRSTPTKSRKPVKSKISVKARTTSRAPPKRKTTSRTPSKSPAKKKTTTKKVISKTALQTKTKSQVKSKKPAQAYASVASTRSTSKSLSLPKPTIQKRTTSSRQVTRKATSNKVAVSKLKTTTTVQDMESFRDSSFVRFVSVLNLPSRTTSEIIIPVVKIKWRRSIIQSMTSLPLTIEAEVASTNARSRFKKKLFQEKLTLEKASLNDSCHLAVPINLMNSQGEFQIKFIVRNLKTRKVLATESRLFSLRNNSKQKFASIKSLQIPSNQVGDSSVKIKIQTKKRNTRGRIVLWALSQRGVLKLYDKKSKFGNATFTANLPILIPPSMCSSKWFIFAEYTAKGVTTGAYTKTTPPLAKVAKVSLSGNPPLKQRVKTDYRTEITPKFNFKARCEIREVEIYQLDKSSKKLIKRYRLRMRIKKGEKFVLESFDWRPPSLRKGLFRSYKQKTVTFQIKIYDNIGLIDDSIVNLTETPNITVYK